MRAKVLLLKAGDLAVALARESRGAFQWICKKSIWKEETFPTSKITISQINLELAQRTKYLTVFKSKSLTALTITYSFSMVL